MSSLKFIALSGTTGVTENLYVYEYGEDMLVVDCGIGFPASEMYGIDLVIPDFSYLVKNSKKLKGVLISHGHEDHFGAIPFLLKDINVPVYATRLVAGFIKEKLADYKVKNADIRIFNPDNDVLTLGSFKVNPFRVSHSVPDGVGYAIDTPEGRIFHVADYKFDWTPVDRKPFDVNKAANLAAGGALAVVSDCLGSTTVGYTESEKHIEDKIESIVKNAHGQVFFTTISSNISRMQQALRVAARANRQVSFIGRSTQQKSDVAKNLGYLSFPKNIVVPPKQLERNPPNKRLYIISGSYGQPGSALYRVALGEHDFLTVNAADTVIFSSDPAPPGSKANVDSVVDRLIELDVDVHYYDLQDDLHVSGHGSQEDIKALFSLVNPKYFIPVGGTIRHMRAYRDLAVDVGASEADVFELTSCDVVEFRNKRARVVDNIPTKEILVDGLGIGDVGNIVLRDRHKLAKDGIAIVLIQIDRKNNKLLENPEIISRGFVFQKKTKGFLSNAANKLRIQIEKKKRIDRQSARIVTIDFLEKFFFKETGRRPMVLPLIVEV